MKESANRKHRRPSPLQGSSPGAPAVRKPVKKNYGAKARYTLAPGESAYERRRRERQERAS